MKIGLLGHGVVGKGVTEILDGKYSSIEVTDILVKSLDEGNDARYTENAYQILDDPEIFLIAECMGGLEPAGEYARAAIKNGKHFVTSNKKMLAAYLEELHGLAEKNGVSLRWEASVGGGIPWIHETERTRRLDDILSFRGIVNGTTNYILSMMEAESTDFPEALAEARRLGYAEADPTDDIDGYDAQNKCAISLYTAFDLFAEPADIPVFGIRNLRKEDMDFALENGRKIRLLASGSASGSTYRAAVMPHILKEGDPMGAVTVNQNRIELECRTLGTAAFSGQGAGSLPTGHAMAQDILSICLNDRIERRHCRKGKNDISTMKGTYYVRSVTDAFDDLADRRVKNAVITKEIPLGLLLERAAAARDTALFAAEVDR